MLDKKKIISEFLVARGILSGRQLEQARQEQERSDTPPAEAIGRQTSLHEGTLAELIRDELGLGVRHGPAEIDPALVSRIAPGNARRFRCIPVAWRGDALSVAIDNPLWYLSLDVISRILGCAVEAELYGRDVIDELLRQYYPEPEPVAGPIAEEVEDEAPVAQLVSALIGEAGAHQASDIHIEPLAERLRIRVRVDGLLRELPGPGKRWERSLISRIKLMAGMNIAEKRLPQDGRIQTSVECRELDMRVATLPSHYGESLVLRILDRRVLKVEELGFSPAQQRQFETVITVPHGIVLVTGPTGSGKSTTLCATLSSMDRTRKKVVTVEDPVEYQISGINQVQVKPGIGLSFARVLRSLLRQAPDIIMVGEIRDRETARIAVQAALTGHVLFSTLHTNDASGAIPRLVDMGVQPYMVAATLQAVVAQRLIRLLCPRCRTPYVPRSGELRIMGLREETAPRSLWKAAGCEHCNHIGYRGRSGIFELLVVDDEIRRLAHARADSPLIREQARQRGMMTLQEHAREKVLQGITAFTELVRITQGNVDQ